MASKRKNAETGKALPLGWSTWSLPGFTIDSMRYGIANGSNSPSLSAAAGEQSPSDAAYETLLQKLERRGINDTDDVTNLTRNNLWLYSILTAVTFNPWFAAQGEEARVARQVKLRFMFELIVAILVRLFNGKCWVYPIVLLSLWAWKCKVSKPFWGTLSRWKLLYSKKTTEMILADLGNRVMLPEYYPQSASRTVSLSVFDNCLVNFRTSYEGIRSEGDGSEAYLFINWFTVPINNDDVPDLLNSATPAGISGNVFGNVSLLKSVLLDIWSGATTAIEVAEWFADRDAVISHCAVFRDIFLAIALTGSAMDVLEHPGSLSAQSEIIYQNHVPTTHGTAGYADVRLWQDKHRQLMHQLSIDINMAVGDQQSYSRLVWLKRKEPEAFITMVPFLGDFHAAVHMLMAIHILWWNSLICWIMEKTGLSEASIKEDWSSVELYNRYRFFYEVIIVGILAYITEVIPAHILNRPDILISAAADQNKGANEFCVSLLIHKYVCPW